MNSPFEQFHLAAGAVMRPVEGAEYPIRYDRPFAEHAAARKAAGLVDLSFMGKLEVSGPDAREFMQRIVSANLSNITPGSGAPSYLLTAQGKIQHSFDAYATPDGFLLVLEGSDMKALVLDLEKFRFNDKVQYRDFTNDLGALLLAGPNAEKILTDASEGGALPPAGERNHSFIKIDGTGVLAARDLRTGNDGFLLLIIRPAAELVWNALIAAGKKHGMQLAGLAAFDSLRIEAGRPRFGLDYTNEHFPQEIGNSAAFSLDKGCYPGQETVARIDTYGKVHRRLAGLILDSPNEDLPERGDKLLLGNDEVGEVKSWVISPALERPVAFAIIRNLKAPVGTILEIKDGARFLTAKVVDPPFVN
ncbi:MAG: aminomethyltransferase family protein [Planctomycetota bacterium]